MSEFIIFCPNGSCNAQLRLPAAAVGQPLSCPYCKTGIRVKVAEDGQLISVEAINRTWRVPRMFIVPGFGLLLLGLAGVFINLYIALRCEQEPEFAFTTAQNNVTYLRDATRQPSGLGGKKNELPEEEAFAAAAGGAALAGYQLEADRALAEAWVPWVKPWHYLFAGVSSLMAVGGGCILRGRCYWLAFVGCFAAILNLNFVCCVPGALVGIWGLLTLVRDDGRKHFNLADNLKR